MKALPTTMTVEQIPSTCGLSGYKVLDANGQSLAYVYGCETKADADIAGGASSIFPLGKPMTVSCILTMSRIATSNRFSSFWPHQ